MRLLFTSLIAIAFAIVIASCRGTNMEIIRKPKTFNGGTVADATEFQSTVQVDGATKLESTLEVDGAATLNDGLAVTGGVELDSLNVTGPVHIGTGAGGGVDFGSSATPSMKTIEGQNATAHSGANGGDVSIAGGANDTFTPGTIPGSLIFNQTKFPATVYAGSPPYAMSVTTTMQVAPANFSPTVLNLPPLDGSVPVENRIFIFRATNTAGGGKALRLTAQSGDTIEGSAGFFALPTGNGFPYAMFWADLANRNWVQIG